MNCKLGREDFGNRNNEYSGKNIPVKDGPKNIPAMISPITVG